MNLIAKYARCSLRQGTVVHLSKGIITTSRQKTARRSSTEGAEETETTSKPLKTAERNVSISKKSNFLKLELSNGVSKRTNAFN